MNECVFCKIVSGEIAAHVVYEDDKVVAFLDRQPINPGHILVVPKKHEPDFYKLDDDTYSHLMGVVKKLAPVVQQGMNPEKVGLIIAGFDVPHAHVHVVPMHDRHDITSKSILEGNRPVLAHEELTEVTQKLRDNMTY